jgi:hypothetical protein
LALDAGLEAFGAGGEHGNPFVGFAEESGEFGGVGFGEEGDVADHHEGSSCFGGFFAGDTCFVERVGFGEGGFGFFEVVGDGQGTSAQLSGDGEADGGAGKFVAESQHTDGKIVRAIDPPIVVGTPHQNLLFIAPMLSAKVLRFEFCVLSFF